MDQEMTEECNCDQALELKEERDLYKKALENIITNILEGLKDKIMAELLEKAKEE